MNIKVIFEKHEVREVNKIDDIKIVMLKGEKGDTGPAAAWGTISGTLSNQIDLNNALNSKANQTDFEIVENEVNGAETTNGEGNSVTLNDTLNGFLSIELEPIELNQDSTPSPSSPQDIHVISGDNTIIIANSNNTESQVAPLNLPVENLFDSTSAVKRKSNANDSQITNGIKVTPTGNGGWCMWVIKDVSNDVGKKFSMKATFNGGKIAFALCDVNGYNIKTGVETSNSDTNLTYTIPQLTGSNYLVIQLIGNSNNTNPVDFTNIIVNEGEKANTYTPYGTTPIEYCKIGNYKDRFFKNIPEDADYDATRELGKWYLKKNIIKVVLDGSENGWSITNSGTANWYYFLYNAKIKTALMQNNQYSSHYLNREIFNSNTTQGFMITNSGNALRIRYGSQDTLDNFKNWLSTHNATFEYILATPEYILLNDTLQEQLETIYNKLWSYEEETNISQTNDDLPFNIKAIAFKNTFNGKYGNLKKQIDDLYKIIDQG